MVFQLLIGYKGENNVAFMSHAPGAMINTILAVVAAS